MKNQLLSAIIRASGFVEYGTSHKAADNPRLTATEAEKITRKYVMPMNVMDKRLETLAEILVRECAVYASVVSGNQEVGKHLVNVFLGTDDTTDDSAE